MASDDMVYLSQLRENYVDFVLHNTPIKVIKDEREKAERIECGWLDFLIKKGFLIAEAGEVKSIFK